MTAKHYKLIAQALADAHSEVKRAQGKSPYTVGIEIATEKIADALQADNAHFKGEHFLAAVIAYQKKGTA